MSLQAISEIATWSLDILSANECRPERLVPGIGAKAPHPSASSAAAAKHTLLRISFDIMTALADFIVMNLAERFDQFDDYRAVRQNETEGPGLLAPTTGAPRIHDLRTGAYCHVLACTHELRTR